MRIIPPRKATGIKTADNVALDGQLDVSSSDNARDEVVALIDSKPIIVNLEKCTYVSSSGLRTLLMIIKTAKSKGIKLIYAAEEILDVFESSLKK